MSVPFEFSENSELYGQAVAAWREIRPGFVPNEGFSCVRQTMLLGGVSMDLERWEALQRKIKLFQDVLDIYKLDLSLGLVFELMLNPSYFDWSSYRSNKWPYRAGGYSFQLNIYNGVDVVRNHADGEAQAPLINIAEWPVCDGIGNRTRMSVLAKGFRGFDNDKFHQVLGFNPLDRKLVMGDILRLKDTLVEGSLVRNIIDGDEMWSRLFARSALNMLTDLEERRLSRELYLEEEREYGSLLESVKSCSA